MTDVESTEGLVFAERGHGAALELDLHRPAGVAEPPLALYLHGGGWSVGDRRDRIAERVMPVVRSGIAVASASYRLSGAATFPAQLHDVQAAVRWLRAHAGELGVRGQRIGAWGASAGGHLALLAALTAGEAELDGALGEHADQDASLQAVVAWFAPSDLIRMGEHVPGADAPLPPFVPGPLPAPSFEARLLGAGTVADAPELARTASPLSWAYRAQGRFLLMHGDRDGLVPVAQSRALHHAMVEAGADASLLVLADANHEDPLFEAPAALGAVAGFLRAALAGPCLGRSSS